MREHRLLNPELVCSQPGARSPSHSLQHPVPNVRIVDGRCPTAHYTFRRLARPSSPRPFPVGHVALKDGLHVLLAGHLGEGRLQEKRRGYGKASPLLRPVLQLVGPGQVGYDPTDGATGQRKLELGLAKVLDKGSYLLVDLVGADGCAALARLAALFPPAGAHVEIPGVLEFGRRSCVHYMLTVSGEERVDPLEDLLELPLVLSGGVEVGGVLLPPPLPYAGLPDPLSATLLIVRFSATATGVVRVVAWGGCTVFTQ